MGEAVAFPTNGTTTRGYLAVPAAGRGPGVVVIQEWWGLVGHICSVSSERDEHVPPTVATRLEADLKAAGKTADITVFAGADHAFFNDTRPEVYHAEYAAQCWTRMLAFFRATLVPPPRPANAKPRVST